MNKLESQVTAQVIANEIGEALGAKVRTVEFAPDGEKPHWLSAETHPGSSKLEVLGRFTVQHIDRTFVMLGVQDEGHYGVLVMMDDYELQVYPPNPEDSLHLASKPDEQGLLRLVTDLADKFTRGMTQERFGAWLSGSLQLNIDAGRPLPEPPGNLAGER